MKEPMESLREMRRQAMERLVAEKLSKRVRIRVGACAGPKRGLAAGRHLHRDSRLSG